jgi:hypothetical protein
MRTTAGRPIVMLCAVALLLASAACTSVPASGTVKGALEVGPGPFCGPRCIPIPTGGTITLSDAQGSHTVNVGSSGLFTYTLVAGTYRMTGHTKLGVPCSRHEVTVTTAQLTKTLLLCFVPGEG